MFEIIEKCECQSKTRSTTIKTGGGCLSFVICCIIFVFGSRIRHPISKYIQKHFNQSQHINAGADKNAELTRFPDKIPRTVCLLTE